MTNEAFLRLAAASTSKAAENRDDEIESAEKEILPTRTNKEVRRSLEILRQYEHFHKHYLYVGPPRGPT